MGGNNKVISEEWSVKDKEYKAYVGRSPFSHLSYPNPNPNSYPNLTLTLNLTQSNPNPKSNPNLDSNPTLTLTLTLRRVTKVRKWTRAAYVYTYGKPNKYLL